MPDELDQDLLRQFARANEPLSDEAFHARVMAELNGPHGKYQLMRAVRRTLTVIVLGIGAGVAAPLRIGTGRLLALVAGAIVTCIAVLSA